MLENNFLLYVERKEFYMNFYEAYLSVVMFIRKLNTNAISKLSDDEISAANYPLWYAGRRLTVYSWFSKFSH